MSDFAPFPPVKKVGSRWEACVVGVSEAGGYLTNLRALDLAPYLTTAKVWFDVGLKTGTIRGLLPAGSVAEANRAYAKADPDGWIEIFLPAGTHAHPLTVKPGHIVYVTFHS